MHFLYNLSIRAYGLGLYLASVFNQKAKLWVDGRKNWKQNLPTLNEEKKLIWFHCASLGEFDQGLPVMKALKQKDENCEILVTFFSPSGMLHYSKRKHCADYVLYLPMDTPSNASFFLDYFLPKQVYFVKYEFWINFIHAAFQRGIPLFSISANFRKNQHFFKWYGTFFRISLKKFDYFFVQTQESKLLLNSIGISKVDVVGDTRFDQVIETKKYFHKEIEQGKLDDSFKNIQQFLNGQKAIIIGSSWPAEEKLVIPYILSHNDQKFIIAPHDISESHLQEIEHQLKDKSVRLTQLKEVNRTVNCVILDTIGHLSKAYYFGKIAIVGGGFSGKLHNILEPAVFGLPVLFGPSHNRFPEASLFIEKSIAFEFDSIQKLEFLLNELENSSSSAEIQTVIDALSGASEKILGITHYQNS